MTRYARRHADGKNLFTRPLTAASLDVLACIGILLFGGSGFVDLALGLGIPWYKVVSLAFGSLWAAVMLVARGRRSDDPNPGREDTV